MKQISLLFAIIVISISPLFSQEVNGVIVSSDEQMKLVKVWGTHQERGYAVGFLLAEDINDLYENYLLPAFGSYYSMARLLMSSNTHIFIEAEYVAEAEGMAEGLTESGLISFDVDYIDVLIANAFLDIQNFSGKDLGLSNGCSSLMNWGTATNGTDLDGKSSITRLLDWDDQDVIIRNQVIVVHFPSEENEQPWLLIGFAGQMSVLSGFNSSGLAIMQHMLSDEYSSAEQSQAYEPVWFSMRKAIERKDFNGDGDNNCLDINDVILQNHSGYADSYIITGLASASYNDDEKIAIISEVAPSQPYVTMRNTAYEDGISNKNLYAANYSIARNNALNYGIRYSRIMDSIGEGTGFGKQESWDIMYDCSSSCSWNGSGNIQFMQYVPELNYFRLAYHTISGVQACENLSITYNTQELFQMPTNISLKKNSNKLKIYPNPANNELYVGVISSSNNNEIQIYDASGKLVRFLNVNKGKNKIDIGGLNSGIYFVKLNNTDYSCKFVVK